jgi:hypothetical protein
MKRWLITLAVVVVLAPAAALAAGSDATKNASADCTALKAKMGATAFVQAYSSFGACVSRYAQLEQHNQTSANATCTALQADTNFAATHGGKTFSQFYGAGKKGSNAFGNCVSSTAKASSQSERQSRTNPAQTCRAQRTSMGNTAFDHRWGTKATNYKNAFGKCVSWTAHQQSQAELRAAATCLAQETTDVQAFMTKYGNNADKTNAFGKCVSTTKT